MTTFLRSCSVLIGLLGFGLLLPPGLCQAPKGEQKEANKTQNKSQLSVKVFKLDRADPTAVITAMGSLLEEQDVAVNGATQTNVQFYGQAAGGAAVPLLGGTALSQTKPVWRATIDERTNSLVVRGSARHLEVAADLVALADRADNVALPELKAVKAFQLKFATADELTATISALSFDNVRLSSLNEKLLVVIAPDEETKAIASLVKELDVKSKTPAAGK